LAYIDPASSSGVAERGCRLVFSGVPDRSALTREERERREEPDERQSRRTVDPPDWFRALASRRASLEEVIDAILENLQELDEPADALLLFNEVGRLPGAGDIFSHRVTQELVTRHLGRG
jgi:hypothetical protein